MAFDGLNKGEKKVKLRIEIPSLTLRFVIFVIIFLFYPDFMKL